MSGLGPSLFDSVPEDYLQFGRGSSFNAKAVPQMLGLKKEEVSRVAGVSSKSVRYDDNMPEQVRERLEEIGNTMNMVAQAFGGDVEKAVAWFNRPLKNCSSNAPGSRISKKRVAQTRLRNECEGHFGLFAGRFARFGRTYPMAHA